MSIPLVLNQERVRQNMTYHELARASKLDVATVHCILSETAHNSLSLTSLLKMLRGLGKSFHWLHQQGCTPESLLELGRKSPKKSPLDLTPEIRGA